MAHPALLRRMDAQWRLARHYGIANVLIFHKLSDLDTVGDSGSAMRSLAASLLANAETALQDLRAEFNKQVVDLAERNTTIARLEADGGSTPAAGISWAGA